MITVAIPVGPEKHHQDFLGECLDSVAAQTLRPDQVLVIDDMARLPADTIVWGVERMQKTRIERPPWRLGVAHAFNFGVALADNDLVFMLGADDRLFPTCLEECLAAYERRGRADAYYWVGVQYSDGRPDQYQPCNAAMVTKGLWKLTGGFPPESASGAPDCALGSIMLGNDMGHLLQCVNEREPLYWYRSHENSDTAGRGGWQGVILETRNVLTQLWQPPQWGRYE